MLILIAILACIATLVGGMLALRFKDKLHLILGFSAGAIIGVAFFELIPEALELGSNYFEADTITKLVALGFVIYLILDRVVFLHSHDSDREHDNNLANPKRGILGAGSLSLHSFLDGVAIGLAFQVSVAIGVVIAIAVLVHDFSDGINTVSMIVKNGGDSKKAFRWLVADAMAPVLGIISTMFFTLPEKSLAIVLSLFAGFFLYIGASDLIPESHHAHPKFLTTIMTIIGFGVLYIAISLAHI